MPLYYNCLQFTDFPMNYPITLDAQIHIFFLYSSSISLHCAQCIHVANNCRLCFYMRVILLDEHQFNIIEFGINNVWEFFSRLLQLHIFFSLSLPVTKLKNDSIWVADTSSSSWTHTLIKCYNSRSINFISFIFDDPVLFRIYFFFLSRDL